MVASTCAGLSSTDLVELLGSVVKLGHKPSHAFLQAFEEAVNRSCSTSTLPLFASVIEGFSHVSHKPSAVFLVRLQVLCLHQMQGPFNAQAIATIIIALIRLHLPIDAFVKPISQLQKREQDDICSCSQRTALSSLKEDSELFLLSDLAILMANMDQHPVPTFVQAFEEVCTLAFMTAQPIDLVKAIMAARKWGLKLGSAFWQAFKESPSRKELLVGLGPKDIAYIAKGEGGRDSPPPLSRGVAGSSSSMDSTIRGDENVKQVRILCG